MTQICITSITFSKMPNWWTDIDRTWTLFLDRDGVINKRIPDGYVTDTSEFEWLPGAAAAITRLNSLFGLTVVVTNQQGIGKGLMSEEDLDRIHRHLAFSLQEAGGRIDAFYFCPQLASQSPNCRKPNPAMGHQARRDFPEIDFSRSVMVGDSPSDVEFGIQLGMRTIFVQPSTLSMPPELSNMPPDFMVSGLPELAGSLPEGHN